MGYNNGHRRAVPNRKRDKVIGRTVAYGIGSDRPSSGFGYIIIPTDVDRGKYIQSVFKKGTCMIVTPFNEVIKDARIPKRLLRDLKFPEDIGDYGQMIVWINTPSINQVTIMDILLSPSEIYPYDQYTKNRGYDLKNVSFTENVSMNPELPVYSATLSNAGSEDGEMNLIAQGSESTSRVTVKLDGNAEMYADKTAKLIAHEEVDVEVGSEADGTLSTLKIVSDGTFKYLDYNGNYVEIKKGEVIVQSEKISLGEGATEAAVLGDKLKGVLEDLITQIKLITVPTALGPSGFPVNATAFTTINSTLSTILSTINKVK